MFQTNVLVNIPKFSQVMQSLCSPFAPPDACARPDARPPPSPEDPAERQLRVVAALHQAAAHQDVDEIRVAHRASNGAELMAKRW